MDKRNLLVLAIQQVGDIIFSSSSEESDDDSQILELAICVTDKKAVPRMQNYVETVIPLFDDGQFKSHFRYVYYGPVCMISMQNLQSECRSAVQYVTSGSL